MNRYDEIRRQFKWEVPARYNIAQACCGKWADNRSRLALRWEDESGATAAYTFWDIQQDANRLSNALAAHGVVPGDRVAIILPQRPETAIAYMAILQMGAIAVPLSHLFGPDALEYRLENAGVSIAIVEPTTLPALWAVRERLPQLRQVIGAGGARETGVLAWENVLQAGSRHFTAVDTKADDPAFIIYTSGTTGLAKGTLIAHRCVPGNLPGFVHSHDFYPQPGDMFWSPADWAWTGGLMDALLPSWALGQPLLGYRGRFDAGKAFYLLEKYTVRNAFIFPTALKFMMKAVPEPSKNYDLSLRTLMSAGESVGVPVMEWARDQLRVTINEMFGQTEANYVVGNCQAAWPVKPGSIGLPETGIGTIPGWGGSVRLPRLIGAEPALEHIVNARLLPADQALAHGLVDEVVPAAELKARAKVLALALAQKGKPARHLVPVPTGKFFQEFRQRAWPDAAGEATAVRQAIEVVEQGAGIEEAAAMLIEARGFAAVTPGEPCRQRIQAFFGRKR